MTGSTKRIQDEPGGAKPFFSVVIPAYNVVDYLDECLESVLNNLLEDYEIVLIDDGSSDGTSNLVDEWAQRDLRVKTVHQRNGGLSAARNAGIAVARGRYVVFLDADDCLAPWALVDLSNIIHSASEPDVVITEISNVRDMTQMPLRSDEICIGSVHLSKDDAFRYVFTEKAHTWPAPQYLMKRSYIEKAGLAFANGILHEDVCWTAEAMASAGSFAAYSHPWYIRRYGRDGSIMSSTNVRHITDTVQAVKIARDSSNFTELTESQANLLEKRLAMSLFPSLRQYGKLDGAEKTQAVACVEENLNLFALSHKPAHRFFVAVCKILGVALALRLVSYRY